MPLVGVFGQSSESGISRLSFITFDIQCQSELEYADGWISTSNLIAIPSNEEVALELHNEKEAFSSMITLVVILTIILFSMVILITLRLLSSKKKLCFPKHR